jgi:hypothetical protein
VVVVAHDSGSSETLDLVARVSLFVHSDFFQLVCIYFLNMQILVRKVEDQRVHRALIIWI